MNRSISTLLLFVLGSLPLCSQEPAQRPFVGAVTESSATVQVWLKAEGSVVVQYGTDAGLSAAQSSAPVTASASTDFNAKVVLTGLSPDTRYYYRLATESGTAVSAVQEFETFPTSLVDAPVNILFGSCQQRRDDDSGVVFNLAPGLDPDLFIQLGDWTYPDYRVAGYPTTDESVTQSYALRLDSAYPMSSKVLATTPIAYVWDDHDWAGNNSDGDVPADVRARLIAGYRNHIPHYPLPNDAGVWQSFMIGNVEVFMIDDRSQRNPVENAIGASGGFNPPPGHSMLAGYPVSGTDQLDWLVESIRSSKARWKILVSPVWFNPATETGIRLALLIGRRDIAVELADKWSGYPHDTAAVAPVLRSEAGRNLAIITGDAHTNLYDDGTHSIVPEFMVGNLDITNSNIYSLLAGNGLNIWTDGQDTTQKERTIGRIRVETSPVHKLVLESFDEFGRQVFSYEMIDTSSTTGAVEPAQENVLKSVREVTVADGGATLVVNATSTLPRNTVVTLHEIDGGEVFREVLVSERSGAIRMALPRRLPSGTYIARVSSGGKSEGFPVVVVR